MDSAVGVSRFELLARVEFDFHVSRQLLLQGFSMRVLQSLLLYRTKFSSSHAFLWPVLRFGCLV